MEDGVVNSQWLSPWVSLVISYPVLGLGYEKSVFAFTAFANPQNNPRKEVLSTPYSPIPQCSVYR